MNTKPSIRILTMLRDYDYNRYLACLSARSQDRPLYAAMATLHYEAFTAADPKRDPVARHMRLEWWRAALQEAFEGTPRNHELLQVFAQLAQHYGTDLHTAHIDTLINAAAAFRDAALPTDISAWTQCCADTSGGWGYAAAAALCPEDPKAMAYACHAGALRGAVACVFGAVGSHPNRRALFPQELLTRHDLTETHIIERMRPAATAALLEDCCAIILELDETEQKAFKAFSRKERRALYPLRALARMAFRDMLRARRAGFPPNAGSGRARAGAVMIQALRDNAAR